MKFEFSAGGIVYKRETMRKNNSRNHAKTILILVAQHSQHHGWVFPKGLIDAHKKETREEAALREVEEETGVIGKILKPLSPVTYWYVWEKEKIKKTVYYFIMEYLSGDIAKHDMEMENVEWIPTDGVEERLTFKADKKVWQEAKRLMADGK
ncbi:MAG TPA: NUDIX domain-containing protein [Xanthomonadales bacterium]|nr:NUDIX domain-containing protein [Xanthomonadales bacterium]